MTTDIYITGINHNSAPIEIREKFTLDDSAQFDALVELASIVDEVVMLSTCNRTEIIYYAPEGWQRDEVRKYLLDLGGVNPEQFDTHFYCLDQSKALTHLFRVAAGLDSMVLGEAQILGQIKSAFQLSIDNGFTKEKFFSIYQHMLNIAKTVRTQTRLGHGSVSVSTIAVQLARNIFEDLDGKNVVLVGAGEMCELAGELFRKSGVVDIRVVNRSAHRADALAEKFSGSAHGLEELAGVLADADIVLTSISSDKSLIRRDLISPVMETRRGRPLFVIDIGVPRNVDADVNAVRDVYLYNMDDLQRLVDKNILEKQKEALIAEKMILRKVDDLSRANGHLAGELILSLQERVGTVKNEELAKLFRRSKTLSTRDKEEVEKSVNLIVNKILHDPIISLRRGLKDEDSSPRYIRVFKDFFNL